METRQAIADGVTRGLLIAAPIGAAIAVAFNFGRLVALF